MENLQDVIRLGSKLDILYVEDDQTLLEETRSIFEKIFKSVDVASSGSEGLMKFSKDKYDLIITDIEMPDLNGLQMSQNIKKIDDQIPIVVISAYSNSQYLIEAINTGINYYVLKPILLPQLLSTLSNVVELIENRRISYECHKREIDENVRMAKVQLFNAMTVSSPNPVVICDGQHVSFYNESFSKLFDVDELRILKETEGALINFLEEKIDVNNLFKGEHTFVKNLDFKNLDDDVGIKLSLKTKMGTKIYLMSKKHLSVVEENDMMMFTFNDITALSFQDIQLKEYDKVIGSLTQKQYRTEHNSMRESIVDKTEFTSEDERR